MPETVLDTEILSEIFKRKNTAVLVNARRYVEQEGTLSFTSVSVVEMLSGLYQRPANDSWKPRYCF